MPHSIGPNQIEEAFKLHSTSAWIWLYEVHIGSSEVAYLTSYDEQVTFDGNTYYPYPMTDPTVPEAGTTNANTTTITVFNIDDMLTDRLRDKELQGQSLFIRLVHSDHLSETDIIAHETTILGAESIYNGKTVRFTVGIRNWLNQIVGRRFIRTKCHHEFGGPACGYDTERAGALSSCKLTYSDCEAHGVEEAAKGFRVLHPKRFGGFVGIPSTNRG